MSITFVAVICEADDPCSGNTAYDPEPSFAMSPRSTSIFEIVGPTPNSGDDRAPSTMQKCTVLHSFLASAITSFVLLTLGSCHASIFSIFSHSFSSAAFAFGIFNA